MTGGNQLYQRLIALETVCQCSTRAAASSSCSSQLAPVQRGASDPGCSWLQLWLHYQLSVNMTNWIMSQPHSARSGWMKGNLLCRVWYSRKRTGIGCLDLGLPLPLTGHLILDKSLFSESSLLICRMKNLEWMIMTKNILGTELCARLWVKDLMSISSFNAQTNEC